MADKAGGQTRNGIVSGGDADGGKALDFDDEEIYSGRRARAHSGGTAASTGAASGIGEATARRFSAEGAMVALAGDKAAALERVAR